MNLRPSKSALRSSGLFADICLIATTLIWGVNIVVFKWAIDSLDPLAFNAVRLVFSALALAGCVWLEARWTGGQFWPRSTPDKPIPWLRVCWFAFLTGLIYMLFFLHGINDTTAGNTALLMATMPMWTAGLSFFLLKERLNRMTWSGLAVTFLGTSIVSFAGGSVDFTSSNLRGNILILSAAFSWGLATVSAPRIMKTMTPLQLTFLTSLLTTPIHVLWSWQEIGSGWSTVIQPSMMAALIFSGAFSTGLAYALWNTGVKLLGGSHASGFQNIVTVVAVSGGWILLGEEPKISQILGGIIIVFGVLGIRKGRMAQVAAPSK